MKNIAYPVPLDDIIVIGYRGADSRTVNIRPRDHGSFVFLVWPQYMPDAPCVFRQTLFFAAPNSAPKCLVVNRRKMGGGDIVTWEWALAQLETATEKLANSEIIFGTRALARGVVRFDQPMGSHTVRTIVWSCHQPFETVNGKAGRRDHVDPVMDWYEKIIHEFTPHVIWGTGDTAYSDGAAATTFVDQVYDKPGWQDNPAMQEWLRSAYRWMYRYHWSLKPMQQVMRNYPHLFMWDDHEIRDGWGSEENDFRAENVAMFKIAQEVAAEYILDSGPRMRLTGDAHQAYIMGHQANFITDTRTSRRYHQKDDPFSIPIPGPPLGKLMSDQQFKDLQMFCNRIADDGHVRFFLLSTTVPIVHVRDIILALGSSLPKEISDLDFMGGVRDDVRDSWAAPGNQAELGRLLNILRNLLLRRPDIDIVVISGDVHVANAFEIYLVGLLKPIYQVTTSAITNRPEEAFKRLIAERIDMLENFAILGTDIAEVRRIWSTVSDPNILRVQTTSSKAEFQLDILHLEDQTPDSRRFTIPF